MTPPEDEPIWLDEEERQAWAALVGMLMRLPQALGKQLRRDANISHFEFSVLTVLSNSPDQTMTMSKLAGTVDGSLSRLSQVVTRMEKKEWVARVPDAQDRRTTWVQLRPRGRELVDCLAPAHVAVVRQLVIDPLTRAQLRQLAKIGNRIMQAADPEFQLPGYD